MELENKNLILPLEYPFYEWAAIDNSFYDTVENREIGITFMIRAKNEEKTIENAIRSLRTQLDGKIKYNIVFADNGSTDRTFEIAVQHLNLEQGDVLLHYPVQVAKAGLETYVTPCNSVHSLPWFYQFCLQHCKAYSHVFKWDADFRLPEKLAQRLISEFGEQRAGPPKTRYEIAVPKEDDAGFSYENYLLGVDCHFRYFRQFLWECWWCPRGSTLAHLDESECIEHESKLKVTKTYLKLEPWWENEKPEIKLQAHVVQTKKEYEDWKEKIGPDVQLYCRAMDPASNTIEKTLPYSKSQIEGLRI